MSMTLKQIDFILTLAERDGTYIEDLAEEFPGIDWVAAQTRRDAKYREYLDSLPPSEARLHLAQVNEVLKEVFANGITDYINNSTPLYQYMKQK